MKFTRERPADPEVNLTPLIDVVFLLLIFFMVSTTFERESQVRIELPKAEGEETSAEQPKQLEITIDAEGRYYVNRSEVVNTQAETLKAAMSEAAGGDKAPRLLLSADAKTPHQAVITAMDVARQLGFVNLTFATRRPGEE